jgi:hypothetical protein
VDARRRAQIFSRVSRSTAIGSWLKSRKPAQLSEIERAVRTAIFMALKDSVMNMG